MYDENRKLADENDEWWKLEPFKWFVYAKAYKKDGERDFTGSSSDRTKSNGFKQERGRFLLDIRKMFFRYEDREPLEQMAKVVALSIELFQDDMGGGFGQPVIVEGVPDYGWGVGLDNL